MSDLRLALRSFGRAPAFVAVAIVTLSLGIGASTVTALAGAWLPARGPARTDPVAALHLEGAGMPRRLEPSRDDARSRIPRPDTRPGGGPRVASIAFDRIAGHYFGSGRVTRVFRYRLEATLHAHHARGPESDFGEAR
jgi:hypothetical protein